MKFTFKIGEKIKEAWPLYKENLGTFLLLTLVTFILSSIGQEDNFVLSILMLFINLLVSYVWFRSVLNLFEGKGFNPFSKNILPELRGYWYFISTTILSSLIIIAGLVLLIVPGLYLIGRIMFACYISVDKNKNAIDSIKESWNMTKDNGWRIFGKGFIIGLFVISGFLLLLVGSFITYPIGTLVLVMLYREFTKFKKGEVKEVIVEDIIEIKHEEGSPFVEVTEEIIKEEVK